MGCPRKSAVEPAGRMDEVLESESFLRTPLYCLTCHNEHILLESERKRIKRIRNIKLLSI